MKEYKQPIGGVSATVLKLLLNIASAFTRRIDHDPSRMIVSGFLDSFTELVQALSDADPNDPAQIRAVINRLLTEGDFYQGSKQTIMLNIQKINNEDAKAALTVAVGITYRIADVLTDEFEDNGIQLEEMLKAFLSSADGLLFIESLLRLIVDEGTASLISLLLIEALKGVLSDDQQDALDSLKERLQANLLAA